MIPGDSVRECWASEFARAKELLDRVELTDRMNHCQANCQVVRERVAIARALFNQQTLLLADERPVS